MELLTGGAAVGGIRRVMGDAGLGATRPLHDSGRTTADVQAGCAFDRQPLPLPTMVDVPAYCAFGRQLLPSNDSGLAGSRWWMFKQVSGLAGSSGI